MTIRHATGLLGSIAIGAALLCSTTQAYAGADEAVLCAQSIVDRAYDKGFRLRTSDNDALFQGQYLDYTVTLVRGVQYALIACGDGRAYDVDIYLYDENGNLIDRDRQTDAQPVVSVTPRWTGTFRIRVLMYSAAGRAYFTMALLYR